MLPKKLKTEADGASSSRTNKAVPKVVERRAKLFQKYASKDAPDVIGPNQMESLLSDMDLKTMDDLKALKFAWKMKAARRGYFTLEEWLRGLKALKVDTIWKLRNALCTLGQEFMGQESFIDLYHYSFGYYKTETQECLEMERVCQLLGGFLWLGFLPHGLSLVEFLKNQNKYTTINIVQWMSFLSFCDEMNYPYFDNYKPSPRWPPILDDYVELARKRQNEYFESLKIDASFKKYADNDSPDVIGPESIEVLCTDLGVEITDVKVLMLAWKMQAARQGYLTLEEWRKGLKELGADTIDKLREVLLALEQEVMEPKRFEEFYYYSFQYCLTEEWKKYLDIESACQLLELVLGKHFRAQVESLMEFLKNQEEYKGINFDQWRCFLQFCYEFIYPDFEDFDSSSYWPSIMDNYVEWARNRQS